MTAIIAIGIQWGDEGKGKIVDWLSQQADVAVRFQGGSNAGHTVVVNSQSYRLSLLPSNILHPQILSILGNGVVVDPWLLRQEIEALKSQGVTIEPHNFLVSKTASLVLPFHPRIDQAWESILENNALGTTKQGIGPAYEDKVARRAIRVCDLTDLPLIEEKLRVLLLYHNLFLRYADLPEQSVQPLIAALQDITPYILPYVGCTRRVLQKALAQGKNVIFEGAQGALLDLDHGTYPFVTSSNTVTAQALIGSGTPLNAVNSVLGIAKAYVTRVGSGPFPSRIEDESISDHIFAHGQEFGTVTGRKRRIGWFDVVSARQAIQICGVTSLAISKIDVLDHLSSLKICVGYRYKQEILDHLPPEQTIQKNLSPIYESLDGWQESTQNIRAWNRLPISAQRYLQRLETLLQIPIFLISTGPERSHIIVRKDPFRA